MILITWFVFYTLLQSGNASRPATASLTSTSTVSNAAQSNASIQIGSTWKELDTLGINLDNIAQPDRTNQRSAPGPSLRELQQTHHKPSTPLSTLPAPGRLGQSPMVVSPISTPVHACKSRYLRCPECFEMPSRRMYRLKLKTYPRPCF